MDKLGRSEAGTEGPNVSVRQAANKKGPPEPFGRPLPQVLLARTYSGLMTSTPPM